MVILLVIAVAAVAAPACGVVLVALAIRREDAALSLSRRPAGAGQAAARRLLGFHGDGLAVPARSGRGAAGTGDPFPPDEALLGSGDFPADGDWDWRSLAGAGGRGRR
jgi:hypothetical protein